VALAVVGGFTLAAGAAPRAEHVFIISIDGGGSARGSKSRMPVLQKLVKEGACTWTAQTVRPLSRTLPVAHHPCCDRDGGGQTPDPVEQLGAHQRGRGGANGIHGGEGSRFFHRHVRSAKKNSSPAQPGTVDEFSFNRAAAAEHAREP